jgi:glycerate 2-kinase
MKSQRILIAPNAFKGSLGALAAARTIADALADILPGAIPLLCPIADGGNGTVECLITGTHGRMQEEEVTGPLPEMVVRARWGILGDGKSAVIEMAETAGLHLLREEQRNPGKTTTRGVGQLILRALDAGQRSIIIGLGGSATNDGGLGCIAALGGKFLDSSGDELPDGGASLERLSDIDLSGFDKQIQDCSFIALTDVTNVLCGDNGAALTFGAQKGASPEMCRMLDTGLENAARVFREKLGKDVAAIPGSGAAGGLGAGLFACCNATLVSGIDFVLDTLEFDSLLASCSCVVTGEGRLDDQTLHGKGIAGIAERARKTGKPLHVFAGTIAGNPRRLKEQLGLASLRQISPDGLPVTEAISRVKEFLSAAARDFARELANEHPL